MENNILDIFYNYIIKEASVGRVDCFGTYNIIFSTSIPSLNIDIGATNKYKNILIPTLTVNNKQEFDKLLVNYVLKALEFYDNSNYFDEILDELIEDKGISREKVIMTLLWSNATSDDFANPTLFLRNRIAFLDDNTFNNYLDKENIGYSDIFNGDLMIKIDKNKLYNETPYSISFSFINDKNEEYTLPRIYYGIDNDKVYIYAIQNDHNINDNSYSKKINRLLYKINNGVEDDSVESIKDVSLSFVASLQLFLALLNNNNINNVVVPSILLERWNGKEIAFTNRLENNRLTGEEYDKEVNNHILLQNNLTNKLMRTFKRMEYHDDIKVTSYPYELDNAMHLIIDDTKSDNILLNELNNLIKNNSLGRKL